MYKKKGVEQMQKIPLPTEEELENLLFTKLWSKKKVAKHYNVNVNVITRWMRHYDMIGEITPKLQAKKRAITNAAKPKPKNHDFNKLLKRAIKGEVIKVPGFNSDYLEEYLEEEHNPLIEQDVYVEEEFAQDNAIQEC